jgi:dienelactone hydrolase
LVLVAVSLAVACGGGGDETHSDYSGAGAYDVGLTFLTLDDGRPVDVWYPAADSGEIADPFVYNLNDFWPDSIRDKVPSAPDIVVDAYVDIPASGKGPFPVLLESHGLGSSRRDGSLNHRHLASWGFIVVAPEHVERNRAAVIGQPVDLAIAESTDVLLAALELVVGASREPGSVLEGRVDESRVAVDGVSAGGEAAIELGADPRVSAVVARAPAGQEVPSAGAPVMIIAADRDVAVDIDGVRELYAGLQAPKGLAVLLNAGHNTFTDSCSVIRDAGGLDLDALAEATGFPGELLEFGNNGCTEDYVDPQAVKPVINHLQVAQIRWALGIDPTDEKLTPDFISATFPDVLADYSFESE